MITKLDVARIVLQGLITALLAAILVVIVLTDTRELADAAAARNLVLEPRYEYKVIKIAADRKSRTGEEALEPTSIHVDEKELASLGSQGWEIVATYLEVETAYPNFGDSKYVTGLQTNVRPQRLVVILRHRIG